MNVPCSAESRPSGGLARMPMYPLDRANSVSDTPIGMPPGFASTSRHSSTGVTSRSIMPSASTR